MPKRKNPATILEGGETITPIEDGLTPWEGDTPDDDLLGDTTAEEAPPVEEEPALPEEMAKMFATPATGIGELIGGFNEGLDYQRWIIYGNNGTGKTTFLGSIPDVLVINPESGTRSISSVKTGVQIPIKTWGQIEELYWYLSRCKTAPGGGLVVPTAKGEVVVKVIAFDTVTRLVQLCLRSIVLGEREKDISRDIIKATQKDWGDVSQKLIYWLSAFKQLPVDTVWACQERRGDGETDSDYAIMPDLSKSIRNFLCGDAEIIARTYIKQSTDGTLKYVMQFGPSDTAWTKDRTNKLPGVVANPKWLPLIKRINKEEEEEV